MSKSIIRIRGHVDDTLCAVVQCMMWDGKIDTNRSPPFATREEAEKELRLACKSYLMTMTVNFGDKATVILEPGRFSSDAN